MKFQKLIVLHSYMPIIVDKQTHYPLMWQIFTNLITTDMISDYWGHYSSLPVPDINYQTAPLHFLSSFFMSMIAKVDP